ncbi:MAG: hypothetical protein NZ922_06320 [Candidatus Methanomethyliaceae archaeon]|nr:hypothetical protein [Candidatus Methanomethyliaceae archaeon]MDW7971294.1 hypothetical protein [Nitrososphaerota archaeon]
MSHVITESITTIAIIIAASMIAITMMQTLYGIEISSKAIFDLTKESMLIKFKIIFAAKTSSNEIKIWIKNVGIKEVDLNFIEKFTIFLGRREEVKFIPFKSYSSSHWNYSIVNDLDSDGIFDIGETLEIIVKFDNIIEPGDWYIRIATPLTEILEYEFSIGD